jgi:DNA helicase-2/ATP-dependent DNA helicase PcrA
MPSARATSFVDGPVVSFEDADDIHVPEIAADFKPSRYQQDIFTWFGAGRDPVKQALLFEGDIYRNLVVVARAGSGKTTTIIKAIDYAPEMSILLTAFNKPIQEELARRIESRSGAEALTLHALGYRAIRRELGWVRTCKRFERKDWLADQVCGGMPFGAKRLVSELVTKAREIEPTTATVESLIELAMDFDLVPGPMDNALSIGDVARATMRALGHALSLDGIKFTGIDFADMIYLPLALDLIKPEYGMVVVDEAQDMTAAQLELAQRACQRGGRIVIVGDDRQAIYGFRGADSKSLSRLRDELRAATLKLPRTYRCPLSVVALAQKYVPDFEPNPASKDGIIDTVDTLDELVQQAKTGDFVLSRKNAPLMRVALRLLREGKPAIIRGKDFGSSLQMLVRQLAKGPAGYSITAFLAGLDLYEMKQRERLLAMKREDRLELLSDKCETLRYLARNYSSVAELTDRIKFLFVDKAHDAVICSTVHKAKGLEAERVFLLENSFFVTIPCECGHRQHPDGACRRCNCVDSTPSETRLQEEANIRYVAITRTKHHLTHCMAKL